MPEPTQEVHVISVQVNDQPRELPVDATVVDLLALMSLPTKYLAVELNRQLVPRAEHAKTVLKNGDVLEVVTLVGGG